MKARLAALLAVTLLVAACASGGSSPTTVVRSVTVVASSAQPARGTPAALTIFGAASLKGALETTKAAYETAHPGVTLTISADSSAALETQIEQGAPVDVFLSADTTNPKKLLDAGFASGPAVTFAGNKLTVIVPMANPAGIHTPADLARSGVKVIAAGDEVPISKYATQLIRNLAREPGYSADFAGKYAANVASKEDNVKAVVAKIELGEGDAGIVYVTDAKASTKVKSIDVPETANVPASYAGVVVAASTHQDAAHAFLTWFAGSEGQAILASFGFLPPS